MFILSVPDDLQGRSTPHSALQDHQLALHCGHIMETLEDVTMIDAKKGRWKEEKGTYRSISEWITVI